MNLQDTPARYGAVSVFNHWLGATLIVALLAIGLDFEDMPRGEEKLYWLRLHIALGTLALLPLAFRVFWRARSVSPASRNFRGVCSRSRRFRCRSWAEV